MKKQLVIDIPKHVQVAARLKGGPEDAFMRIVDGLVCKQDVTKYPNSLFLFKGDEFYFELENKTLWCLYSRVWSILESYFSSNYNETQAFIKSQVEEHFKMKGVTPPIQIHSRAHRVEEHFKMKGDEKSTKFAESTPP